MYAEDRVVDEGSDREVVEEVGHVSPGVGVSVLSLAFCVKAINLSNLSRFVVSPEKGYSLGIFYFVEDKEHNCFDTVSSSINVVSQEEVVSVGDISTDFEDFEEVMKLPVNVPNKGYWSTDLNF